VANEWQRWTGTAVMPWPKVGKRPMAEACVDLVSA
jgi:hypothetical protein